MFWQAFTWGLGVSCGAAFGFALFVMLLWGLESWTGRRKIVTDTAEKSLAELRRRNELTEETNAKIDHAIEVFRQTWTERA